MYLRNGRIEGEEDLLIDTYTLLFSTNHHHSLAAVTLSSSAMRKLEGRLGDAAEFSEAAAKLFREVSIQLMAAEWEREATAIRMHIATGDSEYNG